MNFQKNLTLALLLAVVGILGDLQTGVEAHARIMDPVEGLFAFPMTRRGRATPGSIQHPDPAQVQTKAEDEGAFSAMDSIALSKDMPGDDAAVIQRLMESVLQEAHHIEQGDGHQNQRDNSGHLEEDSPIIRIPASQPMAKPASAARRVDEMSTFGSSIDDLGNGNLLDNLPQLADRQLLQDADPAFMDNLLNAGQSRQVNQPNANDEVRCIPKVMQVEETVYDRAIKCHHSYQEKCHMTFITDYKSTTQEKCETSFKKNCHITFRPMPFNETVNVCNTPVVRKCGQGAVGPEICSTHYETNCETRYKTYEIEQDEPVCTMELMKKCEDVTLNLPTATPEQAKRRRRQADTDINSSPPAAGGSDGNTITVDQKCEEWPVQKCTLEKKTVKKVHPDTECRKIPREVCVPNDCTLEQGQPICRDEVRMQIQNIPEEDCDLQPEENCYAEAVLVPRLVPTPNCVKVPKEICVDTKTNPHRVKKPVIKEWCYKPSELLQINSSGFTVPNDASPDTSTIQGPEAPTSEEPTTPAAARARLFSWLK